MKFKDAKLLIIDDEEMIVEDMKMLFEEEVGTILMAYNGLEGWEVLSNNPVDCIICDIKMPKMDGLELIKKVRSHNIQTPFIFYTGHGNEELMKESLKYGAFNFLNKPGLENLEKSLYEALCEGLKQRGIQSEYCMQEERPDIVDEFSDIIDDDKNET